MRRGGFPVKIASFLVQIRKKTNKNQEKTISANAKIS